jgi:hypothetical protein
MNQFNRVTQKVLFRIILLFTAIIFLLNFKSLGQDTAPVNFGKVKIEDFTLNSPAIDSSSNAVIVLDKGEVSFEGNQNGWFAYVFKRNTRIKIINNKGFDLVTVELLLYKNDDTKEKVENLSGVTYNNENGTITETKLNSKDVFEEKSDKNHFYKKFTMPGVKAGSIIEYSYVIKSDFIFNLPSWEFQSPEYPTLWSEYNVTIPGLLSYMAVNQGAHKFDINKSSEGFKNYSVTHVSGGGGYSSGVEEKLSVSSPTTNHRWVMKDVPAFYVENYLSSPKNFIDKIRFQLYKTYDGEDYHDVAKNWKNVSEELTKREDFGEPLNEDNTWLDKILEPVVQENDDALKRAKEIYYYVQKNYTCINHYDKFIKTSLQDVVKKKSGTVGDINLLLIAMLKHEKIYALPVLLSTREFGRSPTTYPLMEQLNYVIARINIDTSDYYLDATIPFLQFGKLPSDCYNGQARVILSDTAVVVNFDAGQLKENHSVSVFINNNDNKEVEGAFTRDMGFYESLDAKSTIANSTLNTYETKLKASYPEDMVLSNIKVDSLLSPEDPVSVKFDFKLTSFGNADIIYFNPLLGEALKENPFYAAERKYPVEMPYATNDVYTLSMEIPKGYKVDELPKSARSALNGTDGSFDYLISADANLIQFICRLKLNKADFTPDDYQTLRDFYAFIVKKEAEQIVFKKIK